MGSNVWTQDQIGKWGEKTFGRPSNALSLVDRADLEFDELKDLVYLKRHKGDTEYIVPEDFVNVAEVLEEMADVVIVLNQIAYYLSGDLEAEVAKKMVKNLKRTWVKTGDGVGRHT